MCACMIHKHCVIISFGLNFVATGTVFIEAVYYSFVKNGR